MSKNFSLKNQLAEALALVKYLREKLTEYAYKADAYDSLLKQYQGLLVKNVLLQDQIDDLERYITWTGDTIHPMRKRN